jgi:uracil DNA glycosylase
VLLLNNCLTVEQGRAGSHHKMGWEEITDAIIAAIVARPDPASSCFGEARRKTRPTGWRA